MYALCARGLFRGGFPTLRKRRLLLGAQQLSRPYSSFTGDWSLDSGATTTTKSSGVSDCHRATNQPAPSFLGGSAGCLLSCVYFLCFVLSRKRKTRRAQLGATRLLDGEREGNTNKQPEPRASEQAHSQTANTLPPSEEVRFSRSPRDYSGDIFSPAAFLFSEATWHDRQVRRNLKTLTRKLKETKKQGLSQDYTKHVIKIENQELQSEDEVRQAFRSAVNISR